MKNIFAPIFVLFSSLFIHAQYYYKDIIGTHEINQTIRLYLTNKVLSAEAAGFDGEGRKEDGFSESQNFSPGQNLLKISSRNKTNVRNEYYRFNSMGLVTSVSDTSSSAVSITTYDYDDKNNPTIIKNVINDESDSIYANEVHLWFYNANGKPLSMLRIVNNNDTSEIRFTLDQKENVTEELPFIKKISREKTYYYYDARNRLTDIVRYNVRANKLLPDYMFEYSERDQVIQKITTVSTLGLGYLIWRYAYDDKGLKTKEASFNRDKVMTGKIEYSYRFGQ